MSPLTRGLTLFLCLFLISATLPVLAQVSNTAANGIDVQPQQAAGNPAPAFPTETRHHGVPWRTPHAPVVFAAPAGAHLSYFGGPVVSNVHIVQVLWGNGSYLPQVSSTSTPSIASFYSDITSSGFITLLSQYNTPASGGTNQTIGNGVFDGQFTIIPSVSGSTVDDTQIQSELLAQINAGHLPSPMLDSAGNVNTAYMIFFPPGITITQGGSSSCVSGGFCAYHGTTSSTFNGSNVLYGVHPDMQAGSGCDVGCGGSSVFNNYTSVASHELAELITDADVGIATTFSAPLAWYDMNNGEIGDICNAQQGSYAANGTTYTIQLEFSNAANNCVLPPPPVAGSFGPNENWTDVAYFGDVGTFFADVTGDGKADAIVVNSGGPLVVRRSNGSSFNPNETWTDVPFFGDHGTFIADVTGDGKADAIVVNSSGITVRRSNGSSFSPNETWTTDPYFGSVGTFFADVDGDGKADAIVVNSTGVFVRRSTGSSFGPTEAWTSNAYFGNVGTFLADVTGDGKADAIVVNSSGITVRRSNGSSFSPNETWTTDPYFGSVGTFFADVDGDGKADAIVVNSTGVFVRR